MKNEYENQAFLERWLKHKDRNDKTFIAKLNECRAEIIKIDLSWQKLVGKFVIADFPNLITLNLGNNSLSEIENQI